MSFNELLAEETEAAAEVKEGSQPERREEVAQAEGKGMEGERAGDVAQKNAGPRDAGEADSSPGGAVEQRTQLESGRDAPHTASPRSGKPEEGENSTVTKFVADSGGAKKALRRYIASFHSSIPAELGSAPPCRSYRSLICFCEFQDKLNDIEVAQTKEELAKITADMKPFKGALTDLQSMARAAVVRLNNAADDAKNELHKDKADPDDKSKRGRPKNLQLQHHYSWSKMRTPCVRT